MMWDWSDVPLYHIEAKQCKPETRMRYVILKHDGFGDMSFVCSCNKEENAKAILKILYKDLEEEKK